jgi:hypothetical protein
VNIEDHDYEDEVIVEEHKYGDFRLMKKQRKKEDGILDILRD